MQFVRLRVCILKLEGVMAGAACIAGPSQIRQAVGVLRMKPAPLQLFEMQLKQAVLGVLTPTDLPMLFEVGQCNAHENGHQGHTEQAFNQCKALQQTEFSCHAISMSYGAAAQANDGLQGARLHALARTISTDAFTILNVLEKTSFAKSTRPQFDRNTFCVVCLGCGVRCGGLIHALGPTQNSNSNCGRGHAECSVDGAHRGFAPRKTRHLVRGRGHAQQCIAQSM